MTSNLFTIAPHAPFLKVLAQRALDGTLLGDWSREGPFWLSDVTIILPTRRAALALADEFIALSDGGLLLPDIRTFGGEAADEEPFLPPHEAPALPPNISPATRRLLLCELVSRWLKDNPNRLAIDPGTPNPVQVLSLADSLATLIDDFTVEQVDPQSLAALKDAELTSYWQDCLKFLEIALDNWPAMLDGLQRADAAALRNLRLARQAETAPLMYGDRPVIAAGSTGSVPASATLMRAISQLPRGALVLPGLDTTLTRESLALLHDGAKQPHGHPQYQLVHLMDRVGANLVDVEELAEPAELARTHIVRRALDLAPETSRWHEAKAHLPDAVREEALAHTAIAVAHDEQQQAAAVALASLDAMRRNKRVGIIAPDRNLARRIASELARFNIAADDSAGTPLHQSRAGRLVRHAVAVAERDFAAVDLMALLRNRYVHLGRSRADLSRLAHDIEFGLLRGQRPAPGIAGLNSLLETQITEERSPLFRADPTSIRTLLADLDTALTPLSALRGTSFTAAELAAAIVATLENLRRTDADESLTDLPGAADLQRWATALADAHYPGPKFDFAHVEPALAQLMAGFSVRAPADADPRISIWGRLEARLQPADLMILTALNEGAWPEVADPGPWLNRQMRLAVGLEPPERQHGLAAHDFETAMGAPEVLLTYAKRVATGPATPSRLVQRLTGFVGEAATAAMLARGDKWIEAARRIDRAEAVPKPAARPMPTPPADQRTRHISITRAEQLIRSPYDLYARHTLGLTAVEPLGEEPGARERGTFIHEIFAAFVTEGHDPLAANAHDVLKQLAEVSFARLETIPERRDIWLKRFEVSAAKYLTFERERAPRVAQRFAEQRLDMHFKVEGQPFNLFGYADRIDALTDGTCEIIDFKTGGIPQVKEMQNYLAPQLPLEALIVRDAGFGKDDINQPACDTSALTYIRLGSNPTAFEEMSYRTPKDVGLMDAVDEIFQRLQRHISLFLLSDTQSMPAALFPKPGQRFAGDYDHLSRLKEWTIEAEDAE